MDDEVTPSFPTLSFGHIIASYESREEEFLRELERMRSDCVTATTKGQGQQPQQNTDTYSSADEHFQPSAKWHHAKPGLQRQTSLRHQASAAANAAVVFKHKDDSFGGTPTLSAAIAEARATLQRRASPRTLSFSPPVTGGGPHRFLPLPNWTNRKNNKPCCFTTEGRSLAAASSASSGGSGAEGGGGGLCPHHHRERYPSGGGGGVTAPPSAGVVGGGGGGSRLPRPRPTPPPPTQHPTVVISTSAVAERRTTLPATSGQQQQWEDERHHRVHLLNSTKPPPPSTTTGPTTGTGSTPMTPRPRRASAAAAVPWEQQQEHQQQQGLLRPPPQALAQHTLNSSSSGNSGSCWSTSGSSSGGTTGATGELRPSPSSQCVATTPHFRRRPLPVHQSLPQLRLTTPPTPVPPRSPAPWATTGGGGGAGARDRLASPPPKMDGLTVSAYSGDISSSDAYPTMHRRRRKLPPSAAGPPPVEGGGGGVEDSSSTSFLGLHSSATATDLLYSYSCSSGRLDTGTEFFDDDYDYDEEEDENGDGEYCYDVTPVNNNDDDQERQQVFDDQSSRLFEKHFSRRRRCDSNKSKTTSATTTAPPTPQRKPSKASCRSGASSSRRSIFSMSPFSFGGGGHRRSSASSSSASASSSVERPPPPNNNRQKTSLGLDPGGLANAMTSSIMELFTGLRRKRRGGSGGGGKKQHGKVGPVEDEEDLGGVGGRQHSYEGIAMDNGLMSGPTKSDCRHRRFSMLIDPHQTTAAVAGESSNGNMLLSLINQLKHSEPNLLVSRTTAAENNLTVATTHKQQPSSRGMQLQQPPQTQRRRPASMVVGGSGATANVVHAGPEAAPSQLHLVDIRPYSQTERRLLRDQCAALRCELHTSRAHQRRLGERLRYAHEHVSRLHAHIAHTQQQQQQGLTNGKTKGIATSTTAPAGDSEKLWRLVLQRAREAEEEVGRRRWDQVLGLLQPVLDQLEAVAARTLESDEKGYKRREGVEEEEKDLENRHEGKPAVGGVEALLRNQLDRLRRAHFVLLQRAAQAVGHSGASRCPESLGAELRLRLELLPAYDALYSFTAGLVAKMGALRGQLADHRTAAKHAELEMLQAKLATTVASLKAWLGPPSSSSPFPFSWHRRRESPAAGEGNDDVSGRLRRQRPQSFPGDSTSPMTTIPTRLPANVLAQLRHLAAVTRDRRKGAAGDAIDARAEENEQGLEREFLELFDFARTLSSASSAFPQQLSRPTAAGGGEAVEASRGGRGGTNGAAGVTPPSPVVVGTRSVHRPSLQKQASSMGTGYDDEKDEEEDDGRRKTSACVRHRNAAVSSGITGGGGGPPLTRSVGLGGGGGAAGAGAGGGGGNIRRRILLTRQRSLQLMGNNNNHTTNTTNNNLVLPLTPQNGDDGEQHPAVSLEGSGRRETVDGKDDQHGGIVAASSRKYEDDSDVVVHPQQQQHQQQLTRRLLLKSSASIEQQHSPAVVNNNNKEDRRPVGQKHHTLLEPSESPQPSQQTPMVGRPKTASSHRPLALHSSAAAGHHRRSEEQENDKDEDDVVRQKKNHASSPHHLWEQDLRTKTKLANPLGASSSYKNAMVSGTTTSNNNNNNNNQQQQYYYLQQRSHTHHPGTTATTTTIVTLVPPPPPSPLLLSNDLKTDSNCRGGIYDHHRRPLYYYGGQQCRSSIDNPAGGGICSSPIQNQRQQQQQNQREGGGGGRIPLHQEVVSSGIINNNDRGGGGGLLPIAVLQNRQQQPHESASHQQQVSLLNRRPSLQHHRPQQKHQHPQQQQRQQETRRYTTMTPQQQLASATGGGLQQQVSTAAGPSSSRKPAVETSALTTLHPSREEGQSFLTKTLAVSSRLPIAATPTSSNLDKEKEKIRQEGGRRVSSSKHEEGGEALAKRAGLSWLQRFRRRRRRPSIIDDEGEARILPLDDNC